MDSFITLAKVLGDNAWHAVSDIVSRPGFRMYWLWLLICIGLGVFSWLRYYRGTEPVSAGRLGRFLFPRDVYLHPSAKVDYALYFSNSILFRWPRAVGPVVASTVAFTSARKLETWMGSSGDLFAWHSASVAAFTVSAAIASDFAVYLVHAAHHRFSLLWEFHKVHHTAEVLTPFTVYRKHPLYDLFAYTARGLLTGLLQGAAAYAFIGRPGIVMLLGINVVYAVFHASGSNLRHTHIWLSFGPWVSRVFMSPAQHQIHHSTAERHWNRNYGEVLAIWDWMFGTLYVPREREELSFGVIDADRQEHPSLWAAYLVPFENALRLLRDKLRA